MSCLPPLADVIVCASITNYHSIIEHHNLDKSKQRVEDRSVSAGALSNVRPKPKNRIILLQSVLAACYVEFYIKDQPRFISLRRVQKNIRIILLYKARSLRATLSFASGINRSLRRGISKRIIYPRAYP